MYLNTMPFVFIARQVSRPRPRGKVGGVWPGGCLGPGPGGGWGVWPGGCPGPHPGGTGPHLGGLGPHLGGVQAQAGGRGVPGPGPGGVSQHALRQTRAPLPQADG